MVISKAPLRISFFGGGTDYPEYFRNNSGAVLATAINTYVYNTANPFPSHLFDYNIRLSYRDVELVKTTKDIKHRVFQACLESMKLSKDIELHTFAELPAYTGLGSSSTFTVSLLQALYAFKGQFISSKELGYHAIDIEKNWLNDCVGCQDQMMAAVGGFNILEFRKENDIIIHRIPITQERIEELQQSLVLIFSGIKRKASKVAAKQIAKASINQKSLKQIRSIVDQGYDILCSQKPLSEFGNLLHKTWQIKRSLETSISNTEIDAIYNRGIKAGAIGGKLLGAGGGGFILFYVDPSKKDSLRKAFPNQEILEPKINAPSSQIIYAN